MAEPKGKHVKGANTEGDTSAAPETSSTGEETKKSGFSLFKKKSKKDDAQSEKAEDTTSGDGAPASGAGSQKGSGTYDPTVNRPTDATGSTSPTAPGSTAGPAQSGSVKPVGGTSYSYGGSRKNEPPDYTQPIGPGGKDRIVPAMAGRGISLREATPSGHKKRSPLAIFGIVLASFLLACVCVYLLGVAVFNFLFFPNTKVLDTDISLKPVGSVSTILSNRLDDYAFLVTGQGIRLDLSSQEAGLSLDSDTIAQTMHAHINPWFWPYEVFQEHDETESMIVSVGSTQLADILTQAAEQVNASATPPKNATIAYDEALGKYVVVPEEFGTTIDPDELISYVSSEVVQLSPVIDLNGAILKEPDILSTDQRVADAKKKANTMVETNLALTLGDSALAVLDGSVISQWIKVSDTLKVDLDMTALTAWTTGVASQANSVGAERQYTTPYGKNVTVSGGDYGWTISSEGLVSIVKEAVDEGQKGSVAIPSNTQAATWNGAGHPDFGNRYIDVDLSQQYARMYDESGTLIWESGIVSGNPTTDHSTPSGVFYIKSNAGASELIGLNADGSEDYRTPVQYWMPFRGNSVGFHDADWQPESAFGNTSYYRSHGSHGCVNLPPSKAQQLSAVVQVGDPVVVHY